MPAMTSPLSALRLSGRLMVIQNACPRFSRMTLCVIGHGPTRSCFATMLASICGRTTVDCKREFGACAKLRWRGFSDPDLVVVEGRAADRRDRFGAGQRVDAACRRYGRWLGWTDSAISTPRRTPSNNLGDQRGLAPGVAERHGIAVGDVERSRIERDGSSRDALPSRACDDGVSLKVVLRKLREGLVARRNGCACVRLLDHGPMVRQPTASCRCRPSSGRTADAPNRP